MTNSDVNANDFEEVIDEKTGEKVLRMKKEVAERKGLGDMDNVEFEYVIDQNTKQQIIRIKNDADKLKDGSASFEMITDPVTGQQTIRMKQEVVKKCKAPILSKIELIVFVIKSILLKMILRWKISKK